MKIINKPAICSCTTFRAAVIEQIWPIRSLNSKAQQDIREWFIHGLPVILKLTYKGRVHWIWTDVLTDVGERHAEEPLSTVNWSWATHRSPFSRTLYLAIKSLIKQETQTQKFLNCSGRSISFLCESILCRNPPTYTTNAFRTPPGA